MLLNEKRPLRPQHPDSYVGADSVDKSAPTIASGVGLQRGETHPACPASLAHQVLTCGVD